MPASILSAQSTTPSESKPIDDQTRLFVDDHHILYRPGTTRVLQPLQRHPSNPLIRGGEKPWSRDIAYCSVCRDDRSGKYQLWYQAYAGSTARDRTRRCTVCYAESDDGLTWRAPELDLFDFDGAKKTNIVLVANGGKLEIVSTANQDNPIMGKAIAGCEGKPILGCDVWEHAYYLKYQNRRADYLKAFWNVVNWAEAAKNY